MMSPTPIGILIAAAQTADPAAVEYWKGVFSIAALVVAVVGFLAVLAYLFLRKNQATYERARHLPLDDD
jgi:cbb3-type cytochrome oxidase subunit 3